MYSSRAKGLRSFGTWRCVSGSVPDVSKDRSALISVSSSARGVAARLDCDCVCVCVCVCVIRYTYATQASPCDAPLLLLIDPEEEGITIVRNVGN